MDDQWVLIDTSIFIDYFRKKNKAKTLFYSLSRQFNVATSAVYYFEVFAGAKTNDLDFLNEMFKVIEILPFDKNGARKASELFQLLRRQNKLIDFRDLFISLTALLNGLALATLNLKHFDRIPGLKLYPV